MGRINKIIGNDSLTDWERLDKSLGQIHRVIENNNDRNVKHRTTCGYYGLDSSFDPQYRADTELVNVMNIPNTFTGTIRNRKNIGKTGDELVAQWNSDNPNDPVENT